MTRSGETVAVGVDDHEPQMLQPNGESGSHRFFRHQLDNLEPNSPYTVHITCGEESVELAFRTLPSPDGPRRVAFGILTDLHIRPHSKGPAPSVATRRLYSLAEELAFRYLKRLEEQRADFVLFLGDTFDPLDQYTLAVGQELLQSVNIPCHLLIGNHELYGALDDSSFYTHFDLPPSGYRSFVHSEVAFVLLSTPDQTALDPGRPQFRWLANELEKHGDARDTFLFSHFSLLLHPCVQGWKNDGMQQLDHFRSVLELLGRYSRIRGFIAGHKNVPSRIDADGVVHMLCPQLIQAPCGYSLLEIYEHGMMHNVYEIDEQHYAQLSRDAYGDDFAERYGHDEARNFFRVF